MILNEYGNKITSTKFLEGAARSNQRTWQSTAAKDFDDLVSDLDLSTVLSSSRRLYSNFGVIKGTIDQKSTYCVGNAFIPQFLGEDKEWGNKVQDWLTNWMKICDVRGGVYDFQTDLFLLSLSVDRDGDIFVLLTKAKSGYPMIQLVPAHRVGQRNNEKRVAEGEYKGMKIVKGVIQSKFGRAIAYRVLGDTEEEDRDISASSMIHLLDPTFVDQSRGLPLFAHAINTFRDIKESQDREQFAQLIMSSLVFTETNPFGGPDPDDITAVYDSNGKPSCQSFEGGQIKFFTSGEGSELKAVESNRPSVNYQSFQDRLERGALVGTGWPSALLDAASGKGTADRIALQQGMKAVQDRQHLLMPAAQKIVAYAVATAMELGLLPFNEDWYKWTFSTPPHLSIDFGRDSNELRENFLLGLTNMTDYLESQGKSLEVHLRQRCEEEALAIKIREEVEKQYGVKIDPRTTKLLGQGQLNIEPENN